MQIAIRPMGVDEFELSYQIKAAAIGPHVAQKWGWDDTVQRSIHTRNWANRRFQAIELDAEIIGTIWIAKFNHYWRLGEFYILPAFQNQGLGSQVLTQVITAAENVGQTLRLEYLKWSPVGRLYLRHGFRRIDENETHYFMERPASRINT